MKIMITGGAGFIGSQIQDAYLADGHEVIVIDNLSTGRRKNLNPKAKFYELDICDPKIPAIFDKERPQILNHHAAQIDVRKSVADPALDLEINLKGFINLLEAGRKSGLQKVILASSGGTVYGEQENFPATEAHRLQPVSPYGLNKLGSELYLYFYEKTYGINWVALRYANIYGPRQSPHGEAGVIAIFLSKMLAKQAPVINGDGRQTRDYVYVGDVVEANRIVLKSDAAGVFNIGTGVETDVNAVFRTLKKYTESPCEEIHGPSMVGETLRSSLSSDKIHSELGWNPMITIAEGMQRTTEWFKTIVEERVSS